MFNGLKHIFTQVIGGTLFMFSLMLLYHHLSVILPILTLC